MSGSSPPSTRRTQRQRVADTSQKLLRATIELVAEQGFERTTATEIAVRAGLSRSMVNVRYGSKEALLESLLDTDYAAYMLPPATDDAELEDVLQWIEYSRERIREDSTVLRGFLTLIFESAGPVPSLRQWTRNWIRACEDAATAALTNGQRAGTVRADLDPHAEAVAWVSSGMGLGFRWVVEGDDDAYDAGLAHWKDRFGSYRG